MSKSSLDKLKKEELINKYVELQQENVNNQEQIKLQFGNLEQRLDDSLSLQQETLDKLNCIIIENDNLTEINKELESRLKISENVTTLLSERISQLEKAVYSQQQYSHRECLEITGIPNNIKDDLLEEKTLEIFELIDVKIKSDDVQACHRLKGNRSIIKLSNRKDVAKILKNKKNLKEADKSSLGFSDGVQIYINESLCGYFKGLWSKCKLLYTEKEILGFWTRNGTRRIKCLINDEENVLTIQHDDDLKKLFPNFDFSIRKK